MSHGSNDNKGNDNNGHDNKGHDNKGHDDEGSPLTAQIDWMTFSHEDLYKMVHTGVNLEGAQTAATNWKKIGEDIAGVRANLLKAVEDSTVGWDTESARLARDGLTEVTNWVDDTASYAHKVSAAITTETSNVEAARAAMPPPPAPPASPVPVEPTVLRPALRDRLAVVDQVDGFGSQTLRDPRLVQSLQGGEFAGFETVGTSTVETLAANDAQHRLAADVMASFQRNSAAVDQTVPAQFTPPVNPLNPTPTPVNDLGGRSHRGLPDGPGAGGGGGGTVATGTQNQNRGTTNTSSRYGGAGGYGGGRGGGGGGFAGGMARPFGTNSGSQAGGGGGAGGGSASGGAAGVNEGVRGGAGAAAAASAAPGGQTKAFQNPLAMGGAPMAGAPVAGGGRDDNREHKTASYLEEDDNVFGLDRKAAPPVIGQ
ncbi:PPE domain-containing protein [Lentzea aerocolonigenes]|uniref:PPE domain-containing protein n=1 Tax=Lentzea aerocolonigenes TaxID=68170 RepID=UPI0004C2EF49|nr:PPE domain-containing protein [Lentzea aerocolonigenes]MCP2245581.1 PPE family protein [Lentzea aerocolonigenes]